MLRQSLLVFGVVLLLAVPLVADGPQTGTLAGTVTGAGGEALPGVTVTLTSDRGEQTTFTDEAGRYRFALLSPGTYRIVAALEGMESVPVSVPVGAGQRRELDLVMATATETITVTSEAPLINKFDVGTTASVEAEVAEELSFNTRNFQSVVTMLPGAVHNSTSQPVADTRVGFNGSLWRENAVFVDGVDVSTTRPGGSTRLLLPTSALAEVSADASGFGAEYGRVTGGITSVVTKSGTNNFHGEVLFIGQNPKWRAPSDHLPVPREDDLASSFEASVGGPLKRDRLWFFLARGETNTNETDITRTGLLLDTSLQTEPFIGKLNAQLSSDHSLSLTYVDVPIEKNIPNNSTGDLFSVPHNELGGEFITGTWNWAASPKTFLEARIADQTSTANRVSLARRELDPSKSIHTPLNNPGQFFDAARGLRYNFVSFADGEASEDFPRTQANAAVSLFAGDHEVKVGVDYQDIGWENTTYLPAVFIGAGYDPNLPGGFAQPQVMRVYEPAAGVIGTTSINVALFGQDRISWGDHWGVTVGVRIEDQSHENDVGRTVLESTDVAPRLAVVYDSRGDGRLLYKGTLGRYNYHVGQEVIDDFFSVLPDGSNIFDEFAWNPQTQLYDMFLRHFEPSGANSRAEDVDPYFKDEITLGVEWQFSNNWAFEARGIYWDQDDLLWANDQIEPNGAIVNVLANRAAGQREYRGLQLELNRRFDSGWVLRTNYTLSRAEGNVFGNPGAVNAAGDLESDDFLEAESVIDPATGMPYTAENRFGRGPQDRTHVLNLSGAKVWTLGKHTVRLGGLFWYRTGEPWGQLPPIIFAPRAMPAPFPVVVVPGLRGVIQSSRYIEPRDANELPDTMSLNLTAAWSFPLGSRVEGSLRAEVANVTNEQEQTLVNLITGGEVPLLAAYQFPRELRVVAGLRF